MHANPVHEGTGRAMSCLAMANMSLSPVLLVLVLLALSFYWPYVIN